MSAIVGLDTGDIVVVVGRAPDVSGYRGPP
jgi:hypothetical protein